MKTRSYTVYKYKELSEEAKDQAIELHSNINVDYEWWDYIYDDAKIIGLEIKEFDVYRGTIGGKLMESVGSVCKNIISQHGKCCDTYKLAQQYYKGEYSKGEDSIGEFLHDLLEEYLVRLRKEYEYLTSRKAIEETFEANDYDFTENGEID